MIELKPEDTYLTRAWLEKHGWEQANRIPLFQHDPEIIDADLCVIIDRKDYMVAKFHYMGDKAFEPSAMPDSFEVVGVNNSCDMLEYDHTRLVLAAFVCHLTGFEQIDNAIGGVYEMTMTLKKEQKPKAPAVFNEMLDRPITDYPLSVRALNCLKAADINTLRELVRLTEMDLLKFRNFGKRSISELSDFIKDHDLTWGMDV